MNQELRAELIDRAMFSVVVLGLWGLVTFVIYTDKQLLHTERMTELESQSQCSN